MCWRPHLVLVLGLLGEPVGRIEALDQRFVKRAWSTAAGIAATWLAAAPAEPESQQTRQSCSSQSASSTSSSSSQSASASESDDDMQAGTSGPSGFAAPRDQSPSGSAAEACSAGVSASNVEEISPEQREEIGRVVSLAGRLPRMILGVTPGAPLKDCRKAYHRSALLIHPDKCTSLDAKRAFQILGDAYSQLM